MDTKNSTWHILFIIVAVFLIIVAAFLIPYNLRSLYSPLHGLWMSHYHRALTAGDVNTVQPWMTFDYVNKVFKLPASYLKNTFQITGSRYPYMTFGAFAKQQKMVPAVFLTKVKQAIHAYLTPVQ